MRVFGLSRDYNTDTSWLEEFSALTLYDLARQDWVLHLGGDEASETALKFWETGKGKPLKYVSHQNLSRDLLDLVMPRVTELEFHRDGNYILPPQKNWRSILKNCRDYIKYPIRWEPFLRYEAELEDFLYYRTSNALNAKHKDRFVAWNKQDLEQLIKVLWEIIYRYQPVTRLDSSKSKLYRQVLEVAGDLKVGKLEESITLQDIKAAELSY